MIDWPVELLLNHIIDLFVPVEEDKKVVSHVDIDERD